MWPEHLNLHADTGVADEFKFLEDVEGVDALNWIRSRNKLTEAELTSDPRFKTAKDEVFKILSAKDKLTFVSFKGNELYNFWKDAKNIKGLLRKTSLSSYLSGAPNWDTILDIDQLSTLENEDWVYHGFYCQKPGYERCLVSLSRGGKDADVLREFDLSKKSFVTAESEKPFIFPESKSYIEWVDENTLLVAPTFEGFPKTESGYPQTVYLLKRGEDLKSSKKLYEGKSTSVSVGVQYSYFENLKKGVTLIEEATDFYHSKKILIDQGTLIPLPVPDFIQITHFSVQEGKLYAILQNREEWEVSIRNQGHLNVAAGSVLAIDYDDLLKKNIEVEPVFLPTADSVLSGMAGSRDFLWITTLKNVTSEIQKISRKNGTWVSERVDLPSNGTAAVETTTEKNNDVFVSYENFLQPTTLYYLKDASLQPKKIAQAPVRFDAHDLVVEQEWAVSKDGTKVPYFLVHKKGLKLNGDHPTLLYGYGGFEISLEPNYQAVLGKLWLEKGGVYALSNIRGGGEFGPKWHQSALKENRHKAFEDFFAIAEKLISDGVTSSKKLAIQGGSNGGLLMGVAFTKRPDLFRAVLCQVPLLDMIRYIDFPPGASWIGEYGDPRIPEEKKVLESYSPFQNLKPGEHYPRVFFRTSTKDDRVHPAHARRMAAKMKKLGYDFFYYENIEGGHGGTAQLESQARMSALDYSYLYRELGF